MEWNGKGMEKKYNYFGIQIQRNGMEIEWNSTVKFVGEKVGGIW